MSKKAHRLRFHWPSRADVKREFNTELEQRVSKRLKLEMSKEDAFFDRLDWEKEHRPKLQAQEKLKLMDEWEKKGRKVEQFVDYGRDIEMSIYGKIRY